MRTKVLILAGENDLHAKAVRTRLEELDVETDQWTVTDILDDRFQISISNGTNWKAQIDRLSSSPLIDFEKISAVWFRRPGVVRAHAMPEPWVESFVQNETASAVEAIFRMSDSFWINNPVAQRESTYKLHQLKLAVDCGLNIPNTVVTNDPSVAKRFCDECGGAQNVIYKQVDERSGKFFPRYQTPRGLPTQQLRDADLANFGQITSCAHLFQQKISKQSDVRVTIVGTQIFAAEIMSQEGLGSVDFRLDYSVPLIRFDLPQPIADSCMSLMKRLGLEFGAIDLCRSNNDNYHFLEVNAAGQFLWIENQLGMPISTELAKLLAGKAPPLNG